MSDQLTELVSKLASGMDVGDYIGCSVDGVIMKKDRGQTLVQLDFRDMEDYDNVIHSMIVRIMTGSQESEMGTRIYKVVAQAGPAGISKRKLLQNLRMKADQFDLIVSKLTDLVEVVQVGRQTRVILKT